MRISIRPTDPGHHNHVAARHQGYRAAVTFNGEPQSCVITADSDNGVLVRIKTPVEWDADRSEAATEVLHGDVKIEMEPEMCL